MPRLRPLLAATATTTLLCATAAAAPGGEEPAPEPLANQVVLAPVSHANLTLFPVALKPDAKPPTDVDYLVLDEGMKKKLVSVIEKDGGDVNQLTLRNRSDRPLFLMAGEVVIGGRQDRIIGKNTVVAPKSTEAVPVFCVEHGRWTGRKASFDSAGALAHTELRMKASFGDQQGVWDEVSKKNAARKVSNDTDTYRAVATGGAVARSIADYQRVFEQRLARLPQAGRLVGFAVALDGKVVAIETFGSPRLFQKFQGKLLRSYYVEAVDHDYDAEHPAAAPPAEAVTGFAAKAARAPRAMVLDKASGKTRQFDEPDLKGSEVEGAKGEAVYSGAYQEQ